MGELLAGTVNIFAGVVILFFIGMNATYFVLLLLSIRAILNYLRQHHSMNYRAMVQSEFTTPVSILVPAYNEAATIVPSLHSLLRLDYGAFEVIVVNDGSTDETLDTLVREFTLRMTKRLYVPRVPTRRVRGVYVSTRREWKHLVVVDKENGGKADSLNAGMNVSRYPYYCAIDADSILETDALLKVTQPVLEDERVVAVGGIVRVANGCTVQRGRLTQVRLPQNLIPRFQIIEYLRAFLSGRVGWSHVNGLLIISGAFGLFRKEVVVAAGGYRPDTVGEDMEMVVRLHKYLLERGSAYRVVFVPDPVCWTEVPATLGVLSRQRNRWYRGLLDTLLIHKNMFFRPRFRQVGLLAMPYFLLFELLAPVVEGLGLIIVPIAWMAGVLDPMMAAVFFLVSLVYGVLFSLGAVLLEEISFRRYPEPSDLLKLLVTAVTENFGYRQLTVFWRLRGLWDYVRGVKSWGAMQRVGFARAT